mmetsp:Transcript_113803/g.197761  ORF Transcript_113803/g.197761 Transcript_113803/m.197761 type:complete len:88 (+) Transcript_113803:519-782(+)
MRRLTAWHAELDIQNRSKFIRAPALGLGVSGANQCVRMDCEVGLSVPLRLLVAMGLTPSPSQTTLIVLCAAGSSTPRYLALLGTEPC